MTTPPNPPPGETSATGAVTAIEQFRASLALRFVPGSERWNESFEAKVLAEHDTLRARAEAATRRTDALLDQIEHAGCVAAHVGERTYECNATKPCGLCRLRARAEAAEARVTKAERDLATVPCDRCGHGFGVDGPSVNWKARAEALQVERDAATAVLLDVRRALACPDSMDVVDLARATFADVAGLRSKVRTAYDERDEHKARADASDARWSAGVAAVRAVSLGDLAKAHCAGRDSVRLDARARQDAGLLAVKSLLLTAMESATPAVPAVEAIEGLGLVATPAGVDIEALRTIGSRVKEAAGRGPNPSAPAVDWKARAEAAERERDCKQACYEEAQRVLNEVRTALNCAPIACSVVAMARQVVADRDTARAEVARLAPHLAELRDAVQELRDGQPCAASARERIVRRAIALIDATPAGPVRRDFVHETMREAVALFGSDDGVFNGACFSAAFCKGIGVRGPIDGLVVRGILKGRSDVEPLTGGSHYCMVDATPAGGGAASTAEPHCCARSEATLVKTQKKVRDQREQLAKLNAYHDRDKRIREAIVAAAPGVADANCEHGDDESLIRVVQLLRRGWDAWDEARGHVCVEQESDRPAAVASPVGEPPAAGGPSVSFWFAATKAAEAARDKAQADAADWQSAAREVSLAYSPSDPGEMTPGDLRDLAGRVRVLWSEHRRVEAELAAVVRGVGPLVAICRRGQDAMTDEEVERSVDDARGALPAAEQALAAIGTSPVDVTCASVLGNRQRCTKVAGHGGYHVGPLPHCTSWSSNDAAIGSSDGVVGRVPTEVHESGWQWRPVGDDAAFAPPFGTIRACVDCGSLVTGGPTRCGRCATTTEPKAVKP